MLQASFLVALSAILYGFLGYCGTSIIVENMSITTMLFWRFLIASLWILLFILPQTRNGKAINIDKNVLFFMFILGAAYAGSSGFYFLAARTTGTGLAMVIFFSYPIMIALLSWMIHKEKLTLSTFAVLIAMSIGLVLLHGSFQQPWHLVGIGFALLSAISYAIYIMGSKRFSFAAINSNLLSLMVCIGCTVIFLITSLATQSFSLPSSMKSVIFLLSLGILVTALPIQLMLQGLKYISSMRASIISVLEPIVTVIVGIVLLQESVTHLQILGALMIMGSAILVQFHKEL
ncbi:hypothetical protein AYO45_03175 [Gammaproteobacteria bacterium SCGC AG-212-F23]|nr:hypothetical protein AYO45_03175 [Gammaproteobacteria bacterium SCGC AG-212-F23]